MMEIDPLLDALARAEVPVALGMIEPGVMRGVAVRRERTSRRRALCAVAIAALGLGAVGATLPAPFVPRGDVPLAQPLALAPSHLLAVDL
ncbi:hypothetical protein [Sphingomonas sp. MMS24-J13]|uniref:hypothetical protein n=1 Tax=Sphingomonas sp. MMS24-J13 TaxID=3238686 RepID=UPI00384F5629